MKKIICLATILSLVAPTIQAGTKIVTKHPSRILGLSRDSNFTGIDILPKKSEYESCHVADNLNIMMSRSQTNFTKVFENVVCSNVGSPHSLDNLDQSYCEAVLKCQKCEDRNDENELDNGEKKLVASDKKLITLEAMNFLFRENVNKEMDKYFSDDAKKMRALISYSDKLSPEFKEKVFRCESTPEPKVECLKNPYWDQVVKEHITEKYLTNMTEDLQPKNKHTAAKAGPDSNLLQNNNDSGVALKPSLEVLGLVVNQAKNTTEELYKSIIKNEGNTRETAMQSGHDLEIDQDGVLDSVMLTVLNDRPIDNDDKTNKLPSDELKNIVRNSILNFKNDPIFQFKESHKAEDLEKAMNGITFSNDDFILDEKLGRKALSDKINAIRVIMASKYIKESCEQVSKISQVCKNVSENFNGGRLLDASIKNKNDIFKEMISFETGKTNESASRIEALNRMSNAKSDIYQKYLVYTMQINTCEDKFKLHPADCVVESRNKMYEEDSIRRAGHSQAFRAEKGKEFQDIIKNNEPLQRELRQAGVKLNPEIFKTESISRGVNSGNSVQAKTEAPIIAARIDDLISAPKALFPDPNLNNRPGKSFDPNVNEAMNNMNAIEDNRKNRDADANNRKLNSRLAELENKERTLAKKLPNSPDGVKDVKDESDQLQSLRQQIEDLKKSQSKASKDKLAASSEDVKESERLRATGSSGNNGPSYFGSSKNSYQKNEESNRGEVVANSNANQAAGYSSGSNNNAASRSIASANPVNSGDRGKSVVEKSGSGIMLTKTGEVVIDPAHIPENPKDGDIMNFIEESKGQPFLIRENGILMKVTIELDKNGKPQLTDNGKPRFRKVRLSKAQEANIVKEASNVQKSLKEIGRDPTRLFKLRSLIDQAVQRN
ncbi:MAG: hypothetical protein PHY93_17575 [Bacteriovorax sp.]|nr:hypothetical protein [Bacteriovorax sp.]